MCMANKCGVGVCRRLRVQSFVLILLGISEGEAVDSCLAVCEFRLRYGERSGKCRWSEDIQGAAELTGMQSVEACTRLGSVRIACSCLGTGCKATRRRKVGKRAKVHESRQ